MEILTLFGTTAVGVVLNDPRKVLSSRVFSAWARRVRRYGWWANRLLAASFGSACRTPRMKDELERRKVADRSSKVLPYLNKMVLTSSVHALCAASVKQGTSA